MHNSFILQQYVCYTTLLNMFRAACCSSSGGQIVSPQPLVSSPSVSSRSVCRWRADDYVPQHVSSSTPLILRRTNCITTASSAEIKNVWSCTSSPLRGELSYLAPLGSENISAPYFKQCFFQGGYYPPVSQTPRLPVPRQK